MKEYYVYELWNPIKNLPFYVGFSFRKKRPQQHIDEALRENSEHKVGANRYKIFTIRDIESQGYSVEIRIVYRTFNKSSVINKEIELIAKYGRKDKGLGPLTNMTDGGEGAGGSRIITETEKQKRSKNKLGKSYEELFGIKKAIIIKNKIREKRTGYKSNKPAWNAGLSKENHPSIAKISDHNKGKVPYNKGKRMTDINPDYINHFKGKTHTQESKDKVSRANKGKCSGKNNPMFGKSAVKGRKWYHDDTTQYYLFDDDSKIAELKLTKGRL